MNERNLSRRLSTSVVDALKAHGHILVVKGGATALARELDELMAGEVATIEPRLKPYAPLVGEPTSTFGDETIDQAVEDMVVKLTHALMNSDHVEDVFAEDSVIRRDIFRAVRDGLREPPAVEARDTADHTSVTVKLDTLGYVAATASRRTDPSVLRQALDRAASVAHARFSGFSPELREATFRLDGSGPDERLEIEEAVADELTDLVEQGVVDLPTIERRVDLGRALSPAEQRALRPRIDAAAEATLLRSGCAATWEIADARTIRIQFTPLSEQDGRGVDAPTGAFAREVAAMLANGRAAEPKPPEPAAEPHADEHEAAPPSIESEGAPSRRKSARAKDSKDADDAIAPLVQASADLQAEAPASKRPAAKRTTTAKKRASESAPESHRAKAPSSRKSAALEPISVKSEAAPKSTGKRASSPSKPPKAPTKKR